MHERATLIFLGGRLRYFPDGSTFEVHQFSFRDPSPEHIGHSQKLSAKIATYVSDMEVSSQFLEISSSRDAEQIKELSKEQLQEMGVVTGGQTEVDWTVAFFDWNIGNEIVKYVCAKRVRTTILETVIAPDEPVGQVCSRNVFGNVCGGFWEVGFNAHFNVQNASNPVSFRVMHHAINRMG